LLRQVGWWWVGGLAIWWVFGGTDMSPLLIFPIFLLAHPSLQTDGSVVMLNRKYVGNLPDYFEKNFDDYKAGFESRGELWLGLEKLHQLTSEGSYSLHITLKDWDDKTYVAVYDHFEVGPGHGYKLTVEGFNRTLSTLGDAMTDINDGMNGMKFSAKDLDQDNRDDIHCALKNTGGWWYNQCGIAHLTGRHTESRTRIDAWIQIFYRPGGDRVDPWSFDSWKEAQMTLVPTTDGIKSPLPLLGVENDTFLYVVIALAVLSGVLLLLLVGVIFLIYKMWSTARNAIKKDVNPLYGIEYEDAEDKGKNEETKGKNDNPRSKSVDQHYDYMGS